MTLQQETLEFKESVVHHSSVAWSVTAVIIAGALCGLQQKRRHSSYLGPREGRFLLIQHSPNFFGGVDGTDQTKLFFSEGARDYSFAAVEEC